MEDLTSTMYFVSYKVTRIDEQMKKQCTTYTILENEKM